ncbi:DUF4493 domain-containing protein [Bacteroides caecigallinarum]|uniref:DUF4493 domain-containing protein n=1 Tax=Bacteroides caecigallinarum TaxID=1411144 RepID=UPI001F2D2382|nr:DUF4493 domain-containing protein [Bacteroides caecigallinarum]MCF2593381.1 DUF4493 domain-containing protein [Bacteroides caecigallinarum]
MNKEKTIIHMRRIVQQVIVLLTLCWMMPSCSDETFNYESGEGTGYLCLTLGKVDVEFSSSTRAETVSLPDELIPATADFMVDIQKDGNSIEGFPKKYSDITGEMELAVGSYTVKAEFGENNLIQESPYFSGTSTVQILPGKPTTLDLQVALANAMLVPAVSESLQKHYNAWTLKTKVGETSMTLADNDNIDGYLFVQAGQSVNALFEGTNLLDKQTSHEWTVISSAEARTKYVIQCDPDLSVFSNIQLTATATHTYTEEILTGTDVVLNINSNGAPLELIDSWDIKLSYNGTPIRTYTAKPENGILMTVTDGWPYVPQGSTFSASIHLQTGETFDLSSSILNEIPLPEFTTTVFGNTSYSVYKNSGAETANTKDGSSIFDINAEPSIDSKILNNPNYSNILNVEYKTDSGKNSGVLPYGEVAQFNSLAWQQHNLSAIVSFDGVKKESSQLACHVTGLPYVPSAMIEADWEFASWNCKFDNGTIQLGGVRGSGECTATSKIVFYVPDNVSVKLNTNVTIKATQIIWWQNTTFTVRVNGTEIISQGSNKTEKNYSLSGVGTFSPGAYEVKLNSSYEAADPWSKVHTLHILYN